VSNAIAAPLINKEPISKLDVAAIVFIIIGSVIVVLNSNQEDTGKRLLMPCPRK
jgi:drug/metabolite transporter (DMT)-like permease